MNIPTDHVIILLIQLSLCVVSTIRYEKAIWLQLKMRAQTSTFLASAPYPFMGTQIGKPRFAYLLPFGVLQLMILNGQGYAKIAGLGCLTSSVH
jgi:hypothetical protein